VKTLSQSLLAAILLSACLCGREVTGDAVLDGGVHHDAGPDGGGRGLDGGDAGPDGGDAGIDCSTTCSIGGATYCANQIQPGDSCYKCVPEESSIDWTPVPIGTACPMVYVIPGNLPTGACEFEGGSGSATEYCSCAINGSPCKAPTDCCQGTCQDGGNGPFCWGIPGNRCSNRLPCWHGQCCLTPDGGGYGVCSADDGTCPG
jgi:hypothetical protein